MCPNEYKHTFNNAYYVMDFQVIEIYGETPIFDQKAARH